MTLDCKCEDTADSRSFQKADTDLSRGAPDDGAEAAANVDWLWLDPIDYLRAARFTGRPNIKPGES